MKIRLDFAHGFGKALRLAKRRTHSIQADADGGGVMQKRAIAGMSMPVKPPARKQVLSETETAKFS